MITSKIVELTDDSVYNLERLRFYSFGTDPNYYNHSEAKTEYMKRNYIVVGLYEDGRLIGAAYVANRLGSLWIDEFFISPKYQRNHYGEKLMNIVFENVEYFNEQFQTKSRLFSLESLPSAEPFYEKLNFYKSQKGYYRRFA